MLNEKTILITGGTGSFGQKATEVILKKYRPRRLIIFSRDEFKQYQMQCEMLPEDLKRMRFFLGDVREVERLRRAGYAVTRAD